MGEGNGFNRPGCVSTGSSNQEKAAINEARGDKGTKMSSVSRVSKRDRWHQGRNHSPCVELEVHHQGSLQKKQKRTTKRPQQNLCFMRQSFRERWDFQEKGRKVTRDRSLHGGCGWLFFCKMYQPRLLHLI